MVRPLLNRDDYTKKRNLILERDLIEAPIKVYNSYCDKLSTAEFKKLCPGKINHYNLTRKNAVIFLKTFLTQKSKIT